MLLIFKKKKYKKDIDKVLNTKVETLEEKKEDFGFILSDFVNGGQKKILEKMVAGQKFQDGSDITKEVVIDNIKLILDKNVDNLTMLRISLNEWLNKFLLPRYKFAIKELKHRAEVEN